MPQARSLEPKADALLQPSEDGALMASYSVFVLEPGEQVGQYYFFIILFSVGQVSEKKAIRVKSFQDSFGAAFVYD